MTSVQTNDQPSRGFDPAAAPPGTDAEAAGASPSRGEAGTSQAGLSPAASRLNAAQPELQPDGRMERRPQVAIGTAAGLAAAAVFGGLMWLAVH